MNVIVDGLLINYREVGNKTAKPVIFLHGWADQSSSFDGLAGGLSAEYRCIMVDLPGFGSSQAPPEAWDIPDFSNLVSAFLNKIKVKPYALAGHSNGGAIAIKAVAGGKVKPKRLILLASSGLRGGQKFKKTVYKTLAKPAKAGLALLPKYKREAIKRKLYGSIGSDYMVSGHMKETFKKIVSYDVSADAGKIDIPVLLVYGSDDTYTPPEFGARFRGMIKGSELEIVEGASHFVHQENSAKTTALIRGFLK